MTIYLDLIFFINFFYDFLLLLTVSIILKRNRKIIWHLLSALIGGVSIFLLFIKMNNFVLFILKILTSIIMSLVSFGFVSFKYTIHNLWYLYICSIILAGFLYFLDIQFSYDHQGLLFFFDGFSINYILLIIIAPIILFLYSRSSKKMRSTYNLYYHLKIYFDKHCIDCLAFFDNGNSMKDPITHKPVIIVSSKKCKIIHNIRSPMYVPYNTVSGSSIMKCYKPSYIIFNNHKIYNYLIGESNYKFQDGIDCILNNKLMEDNYV